jgi:hypothetical protein
MSRRLHGDSWTRGFLLAQDEPFVAAMHRLSPTGSGGHPSPSEVAAAIEPVNVAGLADPARCNWYGVDVEDTVRAAHKLDASPDAIRRLFTVTTADTMDTTVETNTT